jgi:predicted  nucleic acid-binding Zn-ribbon protein
MQRVHYADSNEEIIMRTLILAAVVTVLLGSISSVSHAQEPTTAGPAIANTNQANGDLTQMRKSMKQLTSDNEGLRAKVADLERRLRNHSIRDRMTQEEQRAINLEEKLFSIATEEENLQIQLEEVNEQLRPENIEQLQVMGSLRPEEVRESTRRKLANKQSRIQGQMQLLQQSRVRIQSSITVTDMLILNLRAQMQAASHP